MENRFLILLEKNNQTIKEYAKVLSEEHSISKYQANRWLTGSLTPPLTVLLRMASDLNTNISYILGLTELDFKCERYEKSSPLLKMMRTNKITTKQLSYDTKLSHVTIKTFSVDGPTSLSTAKTLAEYFCVSIDYMLGLTSYKDWHDKFTENPISKIKKGEAAHIYFDMPLDEKPYQTAIKTLDGKNIIFSNGKTVPITDTIFDYCSVKTLEEKEEE